MALVLFHQGWTDIINSLGLISHYAGIHDKVYVLIRSDCADLLNFYTKQHKNVQMIYVPKGYIDYLVTCRRIENIDDTIMSGNHTLEFITTVGEMYWQRLTAKCSHFHLIGLFDRLRPQGDMYRDAYANNTQFFVHSFYTLYGLDAKVRIDKFSLVRDLVLEERKKNSIVKTPGPYVLCHDTKENPILEKKEGWINLHEVSDTFFDCIKLLEDAESIHLIDSVWASICYLLDARYKLFENKSITVYCKRGYTQMFTEPYLSLIHI